MGLGKEFTGEGGGGVAVRWGEGLGCVGVSV